ncbi:MAG: class A beta-lactamase-related serine hydrolase [Oscillospiraceae bacterium]|nr:class A beta-lactamase-related serine hydrolase [Oscillospiraceae bacterium]
MEKILLILLVLCMLPVFPAFAEGEESGVIDAAMLNAWVEEYLTANDLRYDKIDFSIGFCYTGTGDCWYYNGDQFYYSAALYMVPTAMLIAEKEAAGELTQESIIWGSTLEFLESSALTLSNNTSAMNLVYELGGNENSKCNAMSIRLTDLPESYFEDTFYNGIFYSARYMTELMKTLYEGEESNAFPHVTEYMLQAEPWQFFNRNGMNNGYQVAQKFGSYHGGNNDNNHCTAIIYTPTPIVVTVMTKNVAEYQRVISEVGQYLAKYSLTLDQKLGIVHEEEENPLASAVSGETEMPETEEAAGTEESASGEALLQQTAETEQTPEPTATPAASPAEAPETAAPEAEPAAATAERGRPSVLLLGVFLIAVLDIVFLVFFPKVLRGERHRRRRHRARRDRDE